MEITAMQELIDEIKLIESYPMNPLVLRIATDLLEKEKEQIQKAFSDGQETPINHPTLPHYSRDEYYNDNYKPETI
jgi:hypothetical protein